MGAPRRKRKPAAAAGRRRKPVEQARKPVKPSVKHAEPSRASAARPRKAEKPRARRGRAYSWLFLRAPKPLRIAAAGLVLVASWSSVNWAYQAVRKPSELLFPVSGSFYKTPTETWRVYGPMFRRHSTNLVTPELLAALAQVEASGNPVARTYWRWAWAANPFALYRPASSAVGMYQMTDGTFAEARRYCVHRHAVVADGPWNDFYSCWFNGLYTRTLPSHATELTAAHLHRHVERALAQAGVAQSAPGKIEDLAAVIHLCGPGAGADFARRGFRATAGQRCGAHDLGEYVRRVGEMRRRFSRLAADTA